MKDSSEITRLIAEMVQRIVETWDPEQIILFGLHARGMAGWHSDVDLLIVMPLNQGRPKIRFGIRRALGGMGFLKDIVVVSTQEMERYGHCPGTIMRTALCEGKVFYERKS